MRRRRSCHGCLQPDLPTVSDCPLASVGVRLLCAGLSLGVAGPVLAQQESSRPPFAPNAQEDDWSFLADPARRNDPLDPLKYIPLGEQGHSYAYFGGNLRLTARGFDDENFGSRPGFDATFHRRVMIHGGVVVDNRVRLFAELKHGAVSGEKLPLPPAEQEKLDLHQLFVEGRFGSKREHRIRLGRQELHYGRGLLISVREGPNVRASHDGALLRIQSGRWRADAFLTRPVTSDFGAFDDKREPGAALWAVYAAGKLAGGIELDLYYLGDRRRGRRYDSVAGDETRHTVGARFARKWEPGWALDAEIAAQFGSVDGVGKVSSIRAWAAYGRVERTFPLAGRPSIALEAGIASGDGDPDDDVLQTFRAPQPPGRYFGNTTPLGPANLAGFTPSISINLAPRTRLTTQGRFFWRASLDDGIYSPPGILIRTGQRSEKRHVGREFGANIAHEFNRHLSLRAMVAHFKSGAFLRETPPGKNVSMGEFLLNFRF